MDYFQPLHFRQNGDSRKDQAQMAFFFANNPFLRTETLRINLIYAPALLIGKIRQGSARREPKNVLLSRIKCKDSHGYIASLDISSYSEYYSSCQAVESMDVCSNYPLRNNIRCRIVVLSHIN